LFPRIFLGLFVPVFAGSFAPASAGPQALTQVHRARPSNFDYLVLASIADSPHILTMASYRPAVRPSKVPARSGKPSPQLAVD
jgi:hypothetical protein